MVSAAHTPDDLDEGVEAFSDIGAQLGVI
jgi:hypothetical protein